MFIVHIDTLYIFKSVILAFYLYLYLLFILYLSELYNFSVCNETNFYVIM